MSSEQTCVFCIFFPQSSPPCRYPMHCRYKHYLNILCFFLILIRFYGFFCWFILFCFVFSLFVIIRDCYIHVFLSFEWHAFTLVHVPCLKNINVLSQILFTFYFVISLHCIEMKRFYSRYHEQNDHISMMYSFPPKSIGWLIFLMSYQILWVIQCQIPFFFFVNMICMWIVGLISWFTCISALLGYLMLNPVLFLFIYCIYNFSENNLVKSADNFDWLVGWLIGWLVRFYGISAFVGYLTLNPFSWK